MGKLKDKTVVIIGATGNIGAMAAEMFAKEDANLVLAGRKIETLHPIIKKLQPIGGGNKLAIQTDASKILQVENLKKRVLECFGGADILLTTVGKWKMIGVDSSSSNFAEQLDLDVESFLKAATIPAFVFNKHFRSVGKGLIVDISSHAAEGFLPGNLTYAPVKVAVKVFLENLRAENGKNSGVKILRIISQLVDTPQNRRDFPKIKEGEWKTAVQVKDVTDFIVRNFSNPCIPDEQLFTSGVII